MSRKSLKKWRDKVQRENAAADHKPAKELQPHQLRGRARRDWIEQQVQERYRREVGDTIDGLVASCMHTTDAFDSQMKESRGEGEGWGPDVTPYEHRMTGALAGRLVREKRTWLREFRQQLEEALADEAAFEEEQAAEGETGARSASDGVAAEGDELAAAQPAGNGEYPESSPHAGATVASAATSTAVLRHSP